MRLAQQLLLLLLALTPAPKPQPHPSTRPTPTPSNNPNQVVNADVPRRDFLQVALGSAAITQQLSAVTAALAVAAHLRLGSVSARSVLALSAAMLVLGEWFRVEQR